jgi:alpha-L-rhamnosidase
LSADGVLGDWLGPQNALLGSPFLVTAYHAYNLTIVAKVAAVLGKSDDSARFQALADARKAFFNATFVNADRKTIATGRSGFGPRPAPSASAPAFRLADTQTSYAVGLGLGVFNAEHEPFAVKHLADAVARKNLDDEGVERPAYSLMTGFIGTAWISTALSQHGLSELAYRQLQNTSYPSWLYAVDQGATTIWERLNGYTIEKGFGGNNSMNSFNHYSFGAVGQWMMARSLGIDRDEPGFQRFILRPEPDPTGLMTWAEGHYDSLYGRIRSAWKVEHGVLTYRATVPANTTATLYLPASSPSAVKEGGRNASEASGVTFVRQEGGKAVYRLASGTYQFAVAHRSQ